MDNRFLEKVVGEIKPFFEENNFVASSDNCYENESKKAVVNYDENRQMFILSVADFSEEEGSFGELREINAWLFDDTQNAKDAEAVGIDFTVSLRKELGIKSKRIATNVAGIDLPTASKSDSMNISGFTKKMLDVYPALKDPYKEHVSIYGNFLYINFFGEYLVECFKETFESCSSKKIKKLYDVLSVAYVKGDKDTVNIMLAVLCAAAYKNETVTAEIRKMLSDNTHFLASFDNFLTVLPKNKKLFKALVK